MRHHPWLFTATRKVIFMAYLRWLIRNQRLDLSSFRMATAAMVVITMVHAILMAAAGMVVEVGTAAATAMVTAITTAST